MPDRLPLHHDLTVARQALRQVNGTETSADSRVASILRGWCGLAQLAAAQAAGDRTGPLSPIHQN